MAECGGGTTEGLSDPLCGRCDYGPLHGQQLPCSTDPDCPCFNDDPEEYRLYTGGE